MLASAGLLAISLFHYLHHPTHIEGFDYLKYVALGAVALEGPLIGLKAFASLRNKVRRSSPPIWCILPFSQNLMVQQGWHKGWLLVLALQFLERLVQDIPLG